MAPKRINTRGSNRFSLSLPATSANLGPAFDAAALAFSLFLKVDARSAGEFSISARGRDPGICERLENNLILKTYREVLRGENQPIVPLALRIINQIPIGKGCGSSAAARLAGIGLAVHYGGLGWNDNRIVGEASLREHHPDNAAACWAGGLAVARMSVTTEVHMASIQPKGKWPLLLVVPPESLSTEKAREVLPAQYSRADAVANIQNSMLLLAGFMQGRADLLQAALEDRIHQPYRAPLCPLLPALQAMAGTNGVLGAVLSGAGPSVLMFLNPESSSGRTKAHVAERLRQSGLTAELISTVLTERGGNSQRGKRR